MEEEVATVDIPPEHHIEMSRNDFIGIDIRTIESLRHCQVEDYTGRQYTLGDICKDKTTILIFVRHFLCYTCEEYIEDLNLISPESLEAAGVQLVVIGCAPWRFIKSFKERLNFRHQIYCDEERKLYDILELRKGKDLGNPKESKHVKSGYYSGLFKTTWRAWESMEWQGDPFQQGGALIIDPNGHVLFARRDERATDHCSINTLLQQVGMEPVSFPKDPQIRIV